MWGERLIRFPTSAGRLASREALFLVLAILVAWLFVNYEMLLGLPTPSTDISVYVVSTVVIYLFLRAIGLVAERRALRVQAGLVSCPECGQWLDDPTAAGREAHNRIELTPKPSQKEIASAIALRKAVDAAHRASRGSEAVPRDDLLGPHGPISNPSHKDLLAAIDDPDLLERLLHSPNAPHDPRFRR